MVICLISSNREIYSVQYKIAEDVHNIAFLMEQNVLFLCKDFQKKCTLCHQNISLS